MCPCSGADRARFRDELGGRYSGGPAPGAQERPAVAFDGTNYLVVWEDSRAAQADVYGARVTTSGQVVDDQGGIPIGVADSFQVAPDVAVSGTSYLVVWSGQPQRQRRHVRGTSLSRGHGPRSVRHRNREQHGRARAFRRSCVRRYELPRPLVVGPHRQPLRGEHRGKAGGTDRAARRVLVSGQQRAGIPTRARRRLRRELPPGCVDRPRARRRSWLASDTRGTGSGSGRDTDHNGAPSSSGTRRLPTEAACSS